MTHGLKGGRCVADWTVFSLMAPGRARRRHEPRRTLARLTRCGYRDAPRVVPDPVTRSFGLGYKLTLVKAGHVFNEEQLTRAVREQVPSARSLSSAGGEISFRLPRAESKKFPGLFRKLEAEREMMGVGGYGVSITSLEEVFLSLEKEAGRQIGRRAREGQQLRDAVIGSSGADGADSADDADDGGDGSLEGLLERQDGSAQHRAEGPRPAMEIEMHPMRVASPPSSRERGKYTWWPMNGHKRYKYQTSEDEEDESLLKQVREEEEEEAAAAAAAARPDRASAGQQTEGLVRGLRGTVTETTAGRRRRSRFLPSRNEGRGHAARAQYSSGSTGRQGGGAGGATMREQFAWLLWKRRVVTFRDWRGALYQVALPGLLVALVLMLLTIDLQLAGPSMVMSAQMFDGPTQVRPGPRPTCCLRERSGAVPSGPRVIGSCMLPEGVRCTDIVGSESECSGLEALGQGMLRRINPQSRLL